MLRAFFAIGTPERKQLDEETNFVEHDLRKPFPEDFPREVDGILLSHVVEHFDAQEAIALLWRCRELLKEDGVLRVSVPDASYFVGMVNRGENTPEAVRRLFDQGYGASVGYVEYAALYTEHFQILSADALWLLLICAGFDPAAIYRVAYQLPADKSRADAGELARMDNRDKMSIFFEARQRKGYPTDGQRSFFDYRVRMIESRKPQGA